MHERSGREPTIYDVAERAGVSISTVSLVLNHPARVKRATLDRVLAVSDELGFVPKARAVVQARSGLNRIAAIAPFTSYPSFSRRLNGVMEELDDSGTQLLVIDCEDIAVSTSPVLASIPVRGHVDGLLNLGVPMQPEVGERLRRRLPTVLLDVRFPGLPSISVDDREGGRMVGRHLKSLGHRRVVFANELETFAFDSPPVLRLAGLLDELGSDAVAEVTVARGPGAGQAVAREMSESSALRDVTAVVASRDLVAFGLLGALRAQEIDVPGRISIVGFDDDEVAEAVGLTTIRHPFEESGRRAVRMLKAMLDDRSMLPADEHLPLKLMVRATTAAPRGR